MESLDIVSVNLTERIVIADDGATYGITDMYDAEGDETLDASEAMSCVGVLPDGRWFAVDLTAFEPVELN